MSINSHTTSTSSLSNHSPYQRIEIDSTTAVVEQDTEDDDPFLYHLTTTTTTTDGRRDDTTRAIQSQRIRHHQYQKYYCLLNFIFMSILFSANHGCVVSCLALASARLGDTGAWQSGILYLTYTGSALLGTTYFVKTLGSRNALVFGMGLYCVYVATFYIATTVVTTSTNLVKIVAWTGAGIGGIGAGFLWTAQGSYFASAAQEYANTVDEDDDLHDHDTSINASSLSSSTSKFAGIFAFIYLSLEVLLRGLSSILLQHGDGSGGWSWPTIFLMYSIVAVTSTVLMLLLVKQYETTTSNNDNYVDHDASAFDKATAAWKLLRNNKKLKYLIGMNTTFGFAAAFMNSYINSQAVSMVLANGDAYIGILTAWISCVAAASSLACDAISRRITTIPTTLVDGKGIVLCGGSVCFFLIALSFVLVPDLNRWNGLALVLIYTLHGIGRATFEGTLKAVFAEYFMADKEGAFANIILQNGLASAIGYILTFRLTCSQKSAEDGFFHRRYCVPYRDGSLHNVFGFELLIIISAVLSILGYQRAAYLHKQETLYARVDD